MSIISNGVTTTDFEKTACSLDKIPSHPQGDIHILQSVDLNESKRNFEGRGIFEKWNEYVWRKHGIDGFCSTGRAK